MKKCPHIKIPEFELSVSPGDSGDNLSEILKFDYKGLPAYNTKIAFLSKVVTELELSKMRIIKCLFD